MPSRPIPKHGGAVFVNHFGGGAVLLHRRAQGPSNGPNDVGFSAGVWLSCNQIGGETRYVCDHPAAVEPIDRPALPRSEAHRQGIQVHGRER